MCWFRETQQKTLRFLKKEIFFILLEATDYSDVEKAIGQCKKTADFTITPVVEQIFY